MARRTLSPRAVIWIAGVILVASAFLPLRFTWWLSWLRGPFETAIAPISAPLSKVASWLRPGEGNRAGTDDPEVAELRRQVEFFRSEYLLAEQRLEQMSKVIEALQDGVPYAQGSRLRRLEGTRVGSDLAAGTIEINRGRSHGVTINTVAVAAAAPQHLVGIVTNVGPMTSSVHVLTDPRLVPTLIEALIVRTGVTTPEEIARSPRSQFRPVGDGTLAGTLGIDEAARVQPGDTAFLDDPGWPVSAQRLIMGRIIRVEDTDKPLFKRLIIRPDLDLSRARAVVLRISADEDEAGRVPAEDGTGGRP